MSKQLQIKPADDSARPLSKEQKRFNNYVERIQRLRRDMEHIRQLDLDLRRLGDERVLPAEKEAVTVLRELVFALEDNRHLPLLTEKQYEKFCDIMLEEVADLLQTSFYAEDAALKSLYDKYKTEDDSWDEALASEQEEMKDMASKFFNRMFGTDFEAADFDDPLKMKEKVEARQAKLEAEEQARAERRSQRKKNDRQAEAEARRKAAETAVNKTAKQIYVDLVRHFHPDKEPDEQKRLEKTEVMKQITVAYEANDHLKLLELQLTLLADRDNVFANYDESQLKYFNDVLRRQVQELEMELNTCYPEQNGNPYAELFHPDPRLMQFRIEQHVREQKNASRAVRRTLEQTRTPEGLKQFVVRYQLSDRQQDGIPAELLQMMGMAGRR